MPVLSAVGFELVVELEESLVRVPTAEVVTLLTLCLRTSHWNKWSDLKCTTIVGLVTAVYHRL